MTQPDPKLAQAVDAVRGAITNLQVALTLIGQMRAIEAPEPQADPDRPKTFGTRGAGTRQVEQSKEA